MIYLADLARKEILENGLLRGSNPIVQYDNLTRKCALQVDGSLLEVNKIVGMGDAVEISSTPNNGASALGEIFSGQRVYDINGKFLGELENAEFSPKFVLKKIWVQDAEFKRGQIFSVGDAIVIRAKTPRQLLRKKSNTARKVSKAPQTLSDGPNTAQNTATPLTQASVTIAQSEQVGQIRKRYGNFNFLLGKTVDKTIVNFQGEVMIKKTERVTKEVLRQAKISGKLIELCLHVE